MQIIRGFSRSRITSIIIYCLLFTLNQGTHASTYWKHNAFVIHVSIVSGAACNLWMLIYGCYNFDIWSYCSTYQCTRYRYYDDHVFSSFVFLLIFMYTYAHKCVNVVRKQLLYRQLTTLVYSEYDFLKFRKL